MDLLKFENELLKEETKTKIANMTTEVRQEWDNLKKEFEELKEELGKLKDAIQCADIESISELSTNKFRSQDEIVLIISQMNRLLKNQFQDKFSRINYKLSTIIRQGGGAIRVNEEKTVDYSSILKPKKITIL